MDILIAGGSGFVGGYLTDALLKAGHTITVLTRDPKRVTKHVASIQWDGQSINTDKHFDLIINLCGESIVQRWSNKAKNAIRESRLAPTRALVEFIKAMPVEKKPRLINASAIGFYPSAPAKQSETRFISPKRMWFSKELIVEWEACAQEASQYGAEVLCLRFGIVLGKGGGIIKQLSIPFKLGLGAVIGTPNNHLSWIHIDDLCRAVRFLASLPNPQLVYNITTPEPATQKTFAKAMAAAYHRPCLLRLPKGVIKALFGQMGEELFLTDQTVSPQHLIDAGFNFQYTDIKTALKSVCV